MGKNIGKIYKHRQSQLSTLSMKEPILSSSDSQTSSSTELTKNNSVLCSQNSTHNDLNIINNYDINSCETPRKKV